ncbi:MAG: carboxypeptidase regulatory-like domain-containing protein [Vicinamibacterales bacterium]
MNRETISSFTRAARRLRAGAAAAIALAGLLGLGATPAAAQSTGTITGVITTSARAPRPIRVTIDQRVCGATLPDQSIVVDGAGHVKNAVVVLTGVKGGALPEPTITNEKCAFVPRVQVTRPDTKVRTTSKDPVLHTTNAFDESGAQIFNLGLPVPGMSIARPIGGKGVVRIACNTHPWMLGWVVVTDEMAAVTAADGTFTLTGVPPGTYELRVWHESLKGAPQKVTVKAGATATANFTLAP